MTTAAKAAAPAVNGWNAEYLDSQYRQFKADPASISPDLVAFFQGFDLAIASGPAARGAAGAADGAADALRLHLGVAGLLDAYRRLGHLAARLDPFSRPRARPPELALEHHRLSPADLDRPVPAFDVPMAEPPTLRTLVERLERTYCGPIGVQIAHLRDPAQRAFFTRALEAPAPALRLDAQAKLGIFDALVRAEGFERFLQKRYPGDKRFSLEGGESLIPLLHRVIATASGLGVEEIVLGMAHRGRLNVLNTVLGKTYEQIFTEFEDSYAIDSPDGSGDVKYHRGYSAERPTAGGGVMHLALASNPSHLEAVDGVVLGRTRAKQRLRNDAKERRRVVPLLIHGDAAFVGQGVVYETLNFSQLQGYTVGGTVHAVVNNLIGFTTGPEDARTSAYCTDPALLIDAPVLHVNAEDPEAVVLCAHLAALYRHEFRRDVVLDMWCFRKYGHNEQDEPSFTQPVLAEQIRRMPGVVQVYAQRLIADGVISEADLAAHHEKLESALDAAQAAAKKKPHDPTIDPGSKRWAGMTHEYAHGSPATGVSMEVIREVCAALGSVPEGFEANPKLRKLLAERAAIAETGAVTHAEGELLAIGSLLLEGAGVRLSGQDARRGTFSHRHAVLRDHRTAEPYTPLNSMRPIAENPDDAGKPGPDGRPTQGRFCVYDSPLSEYGVMAFDYGYSLADPKMLVLWEAQFGDFVNGAQIVLDQFLCSAEDKWDRWSGLTLLLPHGYEGAGPEHSSARFERFLQLCGADNIQVVYPTTGAQMFHLLRRQLHRNFRKPLVVMTPKSMLRIPTSRVEELVSGRFMEILDDPAFAPSASDRAKVRRVVLCSGKLYYELAERRQALGKGDVAIVRVEQFYPFHADLFRQVLAAYPKQAEVVYAQEEPRNNGGYLFLKDLLVDQLGLLPKLPFIGRPTSPTPAVGSKTRHKKEQEAILAAAIGPLAKADAGKSDGGKAGAGKPAPANGVHSPRPAKR